MRHFHSNRLARLSLVIAGVILTACGTSPPSKFYQLSPMSRQTTPVSDVSSSHNVVIALGPVHVADYLDRPQIVTRSGKNELNLSEFDRWAGSLEADISRVLVENISGFSPADSLSVVRWTPYTESRAPASLRVQVTVDRFEGTLGHSVELAAQWTICGSDGSVLLRKESQLTEKVAGSSYDALVAAMSGALGRLSLDIFEGIAPALQSEQARKSSPEDGARR